jgi:hypothetical protein
MLHHVVGNLPYDQTEACGNDENGRISSDRPIQRVDRHAQTLTRSGAADYRISSIGGWLAYQQDTKMLSADHNNNPPVVRLITTVGCLSLVLFCLSYLPTVGNSHMQQQQK